MRFRALPSASLLLLLTAPAAWAQWADDGVPISINLQQQRGPQIVSDGANGALIAWEDMRSGDGDIYVQKLDSSGFPMWTAGGAPVCTSVGHQQDVAMVSDGAGGAIVIWVDYRDETNGGDVYCRRIDANGTPLWTADGVPLSVGLEAQTTVKAIEDGAGGAIVTWRDFRNGIDYDVYAQRVDASGVVQWAANGVAIATEAGNQNIPGITTDGAGGAIIAYSDARVSTNVNIYAQRVSAAGIPQWTDDGVALCTAAGTQRNAVLVPAPFGGAIVTWWDQRSGNFDIYAQHVSSSGAVQWTPDGVAVCTAAGDQIIAIVDESGNGGVLISWIDRRSGTDDHAYAQFVNSAGLPKWTADGVRLCNASGDQVPFAIGRDGAGGAVVMWGDTRNGGGIDFNYDVYASRINGTGTPMWAPDGVLVCDAPNEQQDGQLLPDGTGGAFMTWIDNRADQYDVYAQRILSTGIVPIITTAVTARTPALHAGDVYPNPFAGSAWLDVELEAEAPVSIDVFDVAGRLVRATASHESAGARRFVFDGRDHAGRLLASGVYFYRIRANGATITRKMVIAR